MDQPHLLRHLHELRGRVAFLRSLRPDNQSYKLWLGDTVELVNTVWGGGSPQMAQITAVLRRGNSVPAERLSEQQRYLDRLGRLDTILAAFEQSAIDGTISK